MEKNIIGSFSGDVFVICNPIFKKFNLNAFSYSRIFPDGSRAELWSDPYAMDHSFFVKKYLGGFYSPPYLGQDKVVIYERKIAQYPSRIKYQLEQQLQDQREIFDHDNALLIANIDKEYVEYFFFYTSKLNTNAINLYLSHLEELKRFCNYFKKRAARLIEYAVLNKIILPWRNSSEQGLAGKFKNEEKNYILTKRETEVGYLLLEGKTFKEISNLLYISQRTVEHHIEHMKEKMQCQKKSELIKKITENDVWQRSNE